MWKGHGEVDAGETHAEPAEDQRPGKPHQRAGDERQFHRQLQPLYPERRAIGAEAEIGGVAEGFRKGNNMSNVVWVPKSMLE